MSTAFLIYSAKMDFHFDLFPRIESRLLRYRKDRSETLAPFSEVCGVSRSARRRGLEACAKKTATPRVVPRVLLVIFFSALGV